MEKSLDCQIIKVSAFLLPFESFTNDFYNQNNNSLNNSK